VLCHRRLPGATSPGAHSPDTPLRMVFLRGGSVQREGSRHEGRVCRTSCGCAGVHVDVQHSTHSSFVYVTCCAADSTSRFRAQPVNNRYENTSETNACECVCVPRNPPGGRGGQEVGKVGTRIVWCSTCMLTNFTRSGTTGGARVDWPAGDVNHNILVM
jgi:hypothetical protein